MEEFFMALSPLGKVFAICAVLGSALFFVRLLLQFLGAADISDASDSLHHGAENVGDSDVSFKILSFQSLTAFFMMFGLVGLALLTQNRVGPGIATLGAVIAGALSVWIVDKLFLTMVKMQSSGTLDMENAVGQEGTAYLSIGEDTPGKVQVTVQNHLMTLDAVSEHKEAIKTGEYVRVVRLINGNTLVVEKI